MKPIKREIEDIGRFEEILHILFDQGFGSFLDRLDLMHHIPVAKRLKKPRKKKPGPERLRETFEQLGPTFIKFGQIMAQRPDVVPEEYIEELEKLQDSVPPFEPEKAREIVEEEIGLDNFRDFEEEPVASASIAQVHRARLRSGEEVAVKVRRPGIREQMEKDLDVLKYLAKKADRHVSIFRGMAYEDVKEFSKWTMEELDLEKEGRNARTLKENLGDEERVKIPETYPEYTTERVLVMEYIDGIKANDIDALREMNIDTEEIARTGVEAALKQIIRDGFFHADPHPSNFLVDSSGNLVFLDFGMVGKFGKQMRRDIGLLILHTYNEDIEGLVDDLTRIGTVEDPDLEELEKELEKLVLDLKNTTIEEKSISKTLIEMSMAAADNGVYLPSSLMIAGKGLLSMEGIGLEIYPDFKPDDELTELTERLLIQMYSPRETVETAAIELIENQDLITKLPSKLNQLADRQEKKVEIEKKYFDREAVVATALILSSSTIILQDPNTRLFTLAIAELVIAMIIFWHS